MARIHRCLAAPAVTTVRGFGMVSWNHGGLHYAAVSDVDPRDLKQFAALLSDNP